MNFKQFVLLLVIALAVMGCTQPSDSPVLVAAGDPSKYPRCAGSVEPHKCEALEKKLENLIFIRVGVIMFPVGKIVYIPKITCINTKPSHRLPSP